MTRFISEGRAVADAEKRFGRVFQVERKGGYSPNKVRKIFESGLLKHCDSVLVRPGGFKVKEWSGKVKYEVRDVPASLDWDMYCGPAPLRPFNPHRVGGTHRGYWDHEGGGLADMAHHHLHALAYQYGRDLTAPVEITPYAPPAHPECCGVWGWCELKYADGFTLVLESGEWGERYSRLQHKNLGEAELLNMLSEEDRKKIGRDARSGAAAVLRGGDPHAVENRRQRRALAPRGHDLPSGQCGLPLRTAVEVRPRHRTDHRRRRGQPPGQPAGARPVAAVTFRPSSLGLRP
jgi:hypothetical protein